MNRNRIGMTAALLLVALLGSACVEDIGAMLVVHNERLGQGCEFAPALEGNFLARGTLDITLANRYVMFPTIQNQLQPSSEVKIVPQGGGGGAVGDFRDTLNEGNAIVLEGATVSFTTPPNVTFTLPQNVFIPVSGTVQPTSVVTTALEVLSVEIGNIVRQAPEFFNGNAFIRGNVVTVLVSVKFSGRTSSGTEVESNEFTFPLDICAGCLVVYAPGTLFLDDDNSLTCDEGKASLEGDVTGAANTNITTPCFIGQDDPVDCRLCRTLAADDATADGLCDP